MISIIKLKREIYRMLDLSALQYEFDLKVDSFRHECLIINTRITPVEMIINFNMK